MKMQTKNDGQKSIFKGSAKSNEAITLIALVITIVVLLILAGVSIATLTGDNGLLTKAQQAKEENDKAADRDLIAMAVSEAQIGDNGYQKLEQNNLQKAINGQFGESVATVSDNGDGTFTVSLNNKLYKIQNDEVSEIQADLYISNEEELMQFRDEVNNGNTFEGKTISLLNNIELTEDWTPIGQTGEDVGSNYEGLGTNYFKGNFLGNGYYIDNINIELSNLQEKYNNVGFFSKTFGNIENLELRNMSINISSDSGTSFIGGLTGINYGNIINCKVNGKMEIISNNNARIGGIAGQLNNESILNTSSDIQIIINKAEAGASVGGIVGYLDNNGKCQGSYNIGNITIKETSAIDAGGIIGYASNEILKNCYNRGTIDVEAQYGSIGGIAGNANGMKEVKNIYNFGNINAKMDNTSYVRISGIIGQTNTTEIENAYNIGEIKADVVTNNNSYCGGIVGYNISSKINNTYNIGDIVPNNVQQSGNIVGRNVNSDSEIRNSYYNNDNGMEAYGGNSGYIDDETVKYTTNMPNVLDIINEENAFKEDTNNINNGYPILQWQ